MGVFKRGKFYAYDFMFDGKRYQGSTKTTSKELAVKAERQVRTNLEQGFNGVEARPKFKPFMEAAAEWKEQSQSEWKPRTLIMHRCNLVHLTAYFENKLLNEIKVSDLRLYRNHRLTQVSDLTGRVPERSTINLEVATLRHILKRNKLWHRVVEGSDFSDLTVEDSIGKYLTDEECNKLLAAAKEVESLNAHTAMALSLLTGVRFDELRNLKWENINFDRLTLQVTKSKTKKGRGRIVNLAPPAVDLLREWRSRFPMAIAKSYVFPAQSRIRGGSRVYTPVFSRPMSRMDRIWDQIREKAGVECRWHDLRHTCVSRMAESGASNQLLIAMFGWSSPKMLEVYAHLRESRKSDAVTTGIGNWAIFQSGKPAVTADLITVDYQGVIHTFTSFADLAVWAGEKQAEVAA